MVSAREVVDRDVGVLRPRVKREVALGHHHEDGCALRGELVALVPEDGAVRRTDRIEREPFEERDVVERRRGAPIKIEDDVFPEAHGMASNHTAASRVASLRWSMCAMPVPVGVL